MLTPLVRGIVLSLPLTVAPLDARAAALVQVASQQGTEVEEVALLLRHRPELSVMMIARLRDGEFYLPLTEILGRLLIAHEFDARSGRVSASFGRRPTRYELNFPELAFRAGEVPGLLDKDSFTRTELEIYVSPHLLERVFGLRTSIDHSHLVAEITAREELPVSTEARRRRQAGALADASHDWTVDAHFPRDRRVIDGGMLSYVLNFENDGRSRADMRGGMELLGGALEAHGNVLRESAGTRTRLRQVRWRYVRDESRRVTQVTLGRVYATGARSRQLDGFELTNRPVEVRKVVATHPVEGDLPPDWEVELLLNGRVADRSGPDPLGRFRFDVPLGHGLSVVSLRMIGPNGETREEERAIEIPFGFVPRGIFDYSVVAGYGQNDERSAHTQFALGVTDRLTVRGGADYAADLPGNRPASYGGASLRLPGNLLGAMEIAPGATHRATVETSSSSLARIGIAYLARTGGLQSPGARSREFSLRGHAPWRIGGNGFHARVNGLYRRYESGSLTRQGEVELSGLIAGLRPAATYRVSETRHGAVHSRRSELRLASFLAPGRSIRSLASLLLRTALTWDIETNAVAGSEIGVSRPVGRGRFIESSYRHMPRTARSEFLVRMRVDFAAARAFTSASVTRDGSRVAQALSGTIGWDGGERRAIVTARSGSERGGATMRFFVDENGDGVLNPVEAAIRGYGVRLDRSAVVQVRDAGGVYASDLTAHHRYSVRLLPGRTSNPLWIPSVESFSFIADPYRYKRIDIPFHAAGVIDGSVVRQTAAGDKPVPGLRMRVQGTDGTVIIVPVFGDGTFYHLGVKPGTYVVDVDPAQLEVLDVASAPAAREIEIGHSRDGVVLGNLDFVLVERGPRSP